MRRDKAIWGALAVLASGVLALCADLLTGERALYYRDVQRLFVPLRALVAAELRAGRLPLWNSHQWLGVPLWGDPQSAVLYPPHFVFALLPLVPAWCTSFVLHYLLAAAGTYFFLRRAWRLGQVAALVGGLTYGTGATLASLASLPNMLEAAAWLPVVLWATHAALGARRLAAWMWVGAALGLQALAASLEVSLLGIATALLYVCTGRRHEAPPASRCLLGSVLALAVAAGLVAGQALPALELARFSARPHLGLAEASSGSLHPLWLLQLLVPGLWGSLPEGSYWGGFLVLPPAGEGGSPLLECVYAGLLPWLLAGVALRHRGWPRAFTLGLLGASLVFAFGSHTPLFALLHRLLPAVRYPEKAMVGFAFAAACLVAAGLDAPAAARRGRDWAAPALLLAALGCGVAILGWVRGPELRSWVMERAQVASVNASWSEGLAGAGPDLRAAGSRLVLTALGAGLVLSVWMQRRAWRWSAALVVAFVLGDLLPAGRAVLWSAPASRLVREPRLASTLRGLPGAAGVLLQEPGAGPLQKSADRVPEGSPERLAVWMQDVAPANIGAAHGLRYADGYGPANLYDVARIPLAQWPGLGLRYVVRRAGGAHRSDAVAPQVLATLPDLGIEVAEVAAARPRAYWTARVRRVPDTRAAIDLLRTGAADARRETLLEGAGTIAGESAPGLPDFVPARLVSEEPAHLEIEVQAPADGFLVLNDSFFPGWQARLEGRRAAILRADGVARAVAVPAGENHVTFEYRPASVLLGGAMSAVTALALVLAAWRRRAAGSRRTGRSDAQRTSVAFSERSAPPARKRTM